MNEEWIRNFQEKLDNHYAWPALYLFKFIVPKGKESEVVALFPRHEATMKPSKNGNYTSLTFQMMMPSSESVIDIYKMVAQIEGLIAL